MSNSYDDRRDRPRQPVPPPAQRVRQPYEEPYDDPRTGRPAPVTRNNAARSEPHLDRHEPRWHDPRHDPRTQQPHPDPVTGPPSFDFEPSPLRPLAPSPRSYDAGYQGDPRDIEPPADDLQEAYRETMGRTRPDEDHPAGYSETTPAPPRTSQLPPPPRPDDNELYAPSRKQAAKDNANAAIVPAGSVTGRSLNLVIVIMCFLACLTAGAVYMMNQSAAAWLRDIASEITVQVEPREKSDIDKTVAAVAKFLQGQPGIRSVKSLSHDENAVLLEPWLGQSEALKSLPVPRLIALEVDRNAPPDFTALRSAVAAQFKGVSVDDHRHWQQQIRTVTRSFALGGLAILMLVGAATTAVIVSATRSALSANREIVEVLHFVGATDRFIAREFEKHFLQLGIRAGVLGAVSAMLIFLSLPFAMELLGGGTVTIAEIRRLVGTGTLDLAGYLLLGIVVIVIAALCMLTSRIGVYRILHSQH